MYFRNKRRFVDAVVLVLLVLAVGTLIPAKTTVTSIDAERISETSYADLYKTLTSKKTVEGVVMYGDLWVIAHTSLFGRKQETVLLPCVSFVPSDVGTAGTKSVGFQI